MPFTTETPCTDEKNSFVETPTNTQNDRDYFPRNKFKADIAYDRLFINRSHYSKSIMVSDYRWMFQKLEKTSLHFVNSSSRVNGEYYRIEVELYNRKVGSRTTGLLFNVQVLYQLSYHDLYYSAI